MNLLSNITGKGNSCRMYTGIYFVNLHFLMKIKLLLYFDIRNSVDSKNTKLIKNVFVIRAKILNQEPSRVVNPSSPLRGVKNVHYFKPVMSNIGQKTKMFAKKLFLFFIFKKL